MFDSDFSQVQPVADRWRWNCARRLARPAALVCWLFALSGLALLAGCGPDAAAPPGAHLPAPPAAFARRETWDAIYVQGKQVGYAHLVDEPIVERGRTLLRSTNELQLSAQRFGDKSQLAFEIVSWEDAAGKLLRFETQSSLSKTPTSVTGYVEGDRLVFETIAPGAGSPKSEPLRQTIPWSSEIGGFSAVEQSLRQAPLKAGERRTLRSLEPMINQVGMTELSAREVESTALPAGARRLLRVDRVTRFAGATIPMTLWVDEAGEIWKTRTEAMQQESFRTTREAALRQGDGSLDLGLASVIHLAAPLPHAHQTREVRYLVEMTDGDPSRVFPTGPGQSLRPLGPHSAELTVRAIRPGNAAAAGPAAPSSDAEPTDAERRPNSLIQSDDSRVQELAREAVGDATDPWQVATRLEAYVHRAVKNKNFSQALGSAAEVARSGEGDCTEHAVLLAAMARARGIPARVALGLVYTEPAAMAFHMWTEMYIGGRWVPLDATLGRGGIGAAHLKIAQSSLDGADQLASFLPVAEALGQLKLQVLSSR
ncbi:MAG TPA: transglutaminase domain-containing protein, partial [Pirellulales bacterium]|nr:transglutaminase domain-containing protein [Pirellulales bacterium]